MLSLRNFFCITLLISCTNTFAQNQLSDTTKNLEAVIISASKFAEKRINIAQQIEVISYKTIQSANAQSTGDLLANTGKVFVQKSQQGGSSPVLRGFEASRILLVIDGVRLNNAIYRSGHLQNVITVDQNSLNRVEVVYGPSSTTYGSDALGGTIHFITKAPILSPNTKLYTTGTSFARYSTVNNEKTVHADISLANKKFGWYQAYNYSDFGDLKMGNNYLKTYPNFGRRSKYITQINGIDSVVNNTDDRVQKFSGYKQWDVVQKFLYKPNEYLTHLVNLQLSNSTNIPRYDRLQDVRNFGGTIGTTLRFAQWDYGPQKRLMGAYEMMYTKPGFFKEIKANINYQQIEESRITREYRRIDRLDKQVEKVGVWGGSLSGRKFIQNHEIVVGADAQLNNVRSEATRTNLATLAQSNIISRYPNGNNVMNNYGMYAQHIYKFKNKKLVLNDGFRIQAIHLKSNIKDNSFLKLPDTAVVQNNVALTGNVGIVAQLYKRTSLSSVISSGFRAPNIDDLAKVFESSTAARQVVLPNADIRPEYTYNIDVTLKQDIGSVAMVELTGYYTLFKNAIIKAPFKFNGQDSIVFDGVKSQVLASQNVNNARVYGFSLSVKVNLTKAFTIYHTLSYTKGFFIVDENTPSTIYEKQPNGSYELVKRNVAQKPLDHISPIIGKFSLAYERKKISSELFILFNGWNRLDEFSADGEDNAQYATAEGMPAWYTANWKAQVAFTKNTSLQLGVDNIFDRNYRPFASGFSAGGRNVMLALRVGW